MNETYYLESFINETKYNQDEDIYNAEKSSNVIIYEYLNNMSYNIKDIYNNDLLSLLDRLNDFTKNNNDPIIKIQDEILKIFLEFINNGFDTTNIDVGYDTLFTFEQVSYMLTYT